MIRRAGVIGIDVLGDSVGKCRGRATGVVALFEAECGESREWQSLQGRALWCGAYSVERPGEGRLQ